jgi:enoyl-CoA hydratase/carnithine racemase
VLAVLMLCAVFFAAHQYNVTHPIYRCTAPTVMIHGHAVQGGCA